ncbi:MAG TPA: hypothetical protein VMR52_13025 [Dehalococcoidia bacterium]|nr:hypothetical protein [Dehalococcoidia bacterium]
MAADGSGQRVVIETPFIDYGPAWSPNGETIAFLSDGDGPQVLSVGLDGSSLRYLTKDDDEQKAYLTWSPDGRAIAFAALDEDEHEADGLNEIRVMNADGSGVTRVFTNTEGIRDLVWLR